MPCCKPITSTDDPPPRESRFIDLTRSLSSKIRISYWDNSQITHHGKAKLAESMRNAALLGLMQPNLETSARRTGRYTLFGPAGGNFREVGRFVWNLLAFTRRGSVGRSPTFPFFIVFSVRWKESRLNGI